MARLPPDKRPSLSELAGQDPWTCRVCGCKDWRVSTTRFLLIHQSNGAQVSANNFRTVSPKERDKYKEGPKVRRRFCRNCGEPMVTMEMPIPVGYTLKVVPAPGSPVEAPDTPSIEVPVIEEEEDEEVA